MALQIVANKPLEMLRRRSHSHGQLDESIDGIPNLDTKDSTHQATDLDTISVQVVAQLVGNSAPVLSHWLALIALAWAFHVGIDRMLGYGLKHPHSFTHTHLGRIGKDRRTQQG